MDPASADEMSIEEAARASSNLAQSDQPEFPTPVTNIAHLAHHRAQLKAIDTVDLYGYTTTDRGERLKDVARSLSERRVAIMPEPDETMSWRPLWFIFYGTLRKPDVLTFMTGVPGPHDYRQARIEGFHVKSWFLEIPTAEASEGSVLEGLAWECPSLAALQGLLDYEGPGYKLARCKILMDNGQAVGDGRIFVENDDDDNDDEDDYNDDEDDYNDDEDDDVDDDDVLHL